MQRDGRDDPDSRSTTDHDPHESPGNGDSRSDRAARDRIEFTDHSRDWGNERRESLKNHDEKNDDRVADPLLQRSAQGKGDLQLRATGDVAKDAAAFREQLDHVYLGPSTSLDPERAKEFRSKDRCYIDEPGATLRAGTTFDRPIEDEARDAEEREREADRALVEFALEQLFDKYVVDKAINTVLEEVFRLSLFAAETSTGVITGVFSTTPTADRSISDVPHPTPVPTPSPYFDPWLSRP